MKCRDCISRDWRKPDGWPCVHENYIMYEAYCVIGSTRSTHYFSSAIRMRDFIEAAPDDAMFRIFEKYLDSGEVIELT